MNYVIIIRDKQKNKRKRKTQMLTQWPCMNALLSLLTCNLINKHWFKHFFKNMARDVTSYGHIGICNLIRNFFQHHPSIDWIFNVHICGNMLQKWSNRMKSFLYRVPGIFVINVFFLSHQSRKKPLKKFLVRILYVIER